MCVCGVVRWGFPTDGGGAARAAAPPGSQAGAATNARRQAVAASAGGALQHRYDEHGQPARAHQLWCTTLRAVGVMTRALVPYPAFAVPSPAPSPHPSRVAAPMVLGMNRGVFTAPYSAMDAYEYSHAIMLHGYPNPNLSLSLNPNLNPKGSLVFATVAGSALISLAEGPGGWRAAKVLTLGEKKTTEALTTEAGG